MPFVHRAETGVPEVAMPACMMMDTPMGREKQMATNTRAETVTEGIGTVAAHLFNGASLAALNLLIYGGRTGLAGDAFVSFAKDYGANLSIMLFALLVLAAMWGAMLVVHFFIRGIVAIPAIVRFFRRTPNTVR